MQLPIIHAETGTPIKFIEKSNVAKMAFETILEDEII